VSAHAESPNREPDSSKGSTPQLPELFVSADAHAARARRRYVSFSALLLVFLVVAAVAGTTHLRFGESSIDWTQIIATAAFLLTAIVQSQFSALKPEQAWFEARAAAESVRTLAWRYAVCGSPFSADLPSETADRVFVGHLQEIMRSLGNLPLTASSSDLQQITPWMRDLRRQPLPARIGTYQRFRLDEEQTWYAARAALNTRRARSWVAVMLTFEVVGALAALLTGMGAMTIPIAGLAATVVAVATAWMRTNQHTSLASSYALTARELAAVRLLLREGCSEDEWAAFVDTAEGTISREHTLWRSTRGPSAKSEML
jgi:SMODS and SLOG-associating 2TM effector domain 3/SMODS and SLOG-associating 2TM effector domain 1